MPPRVPRTSPLVVAACALVPLTNASPEAARLADVRVDVGVDGIPAARVLCADLDGDGRPDLLVRPLSEGPVEPTILLWRAAPDTALGFRWLEHTNTGLPTLASGDVITLADLDNDGRTDAIVARYLDYLQENFTPPSSPPARTAWLPGQGDGSFGPARVFEEAPAATTAAIAVGDADLDGLPDVWLGNWYEKYFSGYEAFPNDLLLQYPRDTYADEPPRFVRWPAPDETRVLDADTDSGGRPTYGVHVARLDPTALPLLWEINYGRRWDRLYRLERPAPLHTPPSVDNRSRPSRPGGPLAMAKEETRRSLRARDIAVEARVDGDDIRHGRHPDWIAERGTVDPRFERPDEPPFRANGNGFDGAIGDIDNDGDLDLFVSTIIHAWAGDSSDRSRFLVNRLVETGRLVFDSPLHLSVDRLPPPPGPGEPLRDEHKNQNQGDIFCELADLDHDGRLDLILCSSDYGDPPPYDERLRIFLQQPDGTFRDSTAGLGIDHIGAGQPALADIDGDGAVDLVVGQTFNRLDVARRKAAAKANGTLSSGSPEPRLHVYHNRLAGERRGIVLRLAGDPAHGIARDAFGAIVRLWADLDGDPSTPPVVQTRHLTGPGGHAGKRHDAIVHFGLGKATRADRVEILWPNRAGTVTRILDLAPGTHVVTPEGRVGR
jgi:hypothetical protein